MRLSGKVALITGAARGQGAAAARRFVAEGASVLLTDVLDEPGKELAASLGASYFHLDVSSEQDWEAAVEAARELGEISVLVNNAGVLHFSALADTTLADYQRVISINQVGTFLGMRAVVPSMKRAGGGSIVNVSSVEGLAGMPMLTAYTASKFAIRGMTKVAALELGEHGIRVNSVHPGAIDTAMVSTALGREIDVSPIGKRLALRRIGQPEDVANVVLFLASDESAYCTGGEFAVDGGATATHALGR
ncbi:3-alpha-hydroxysteroid dehydrogenase [Lentzea guizhouensis]|uniref:3-alpha-hydroxysteroid dehydrogenase n=1 Tax=Lentzea guizhouensis TaxID=1586287 RepID=A0A1B2I057_9PSEU|nr:glucose 1-dehydrogenase [Lentzea guizhouensis]ANZ43379.1 3-alpha-hydroxysteroid dehydrogenase [Lentzea guizhouensis]